MISALLFNLLSVCASGAAVYLMDTNSLLAVILGGIAGLVVGLNSRFALLSAPNPRDLPPS